MKFILCAVIACGYWITGTFFTIVASEKGLKTFRPFFVRWIRINVNFYSIFIDIIETHTKKVPNRKKWFLLFVQQNCLDTDFSLDWGMLLRKSSATNWINFHKMLIFQYLYWYGFSFMSRIVMETYLITLVIAKVGHNSEEIKYTNWSHWDWFIETMAKLIWIYCDSTHKMFSSASFRYCLPKQNQSKSLEKWTFWFILIFVFMLPYWISREWEIKQNNNEGKSLVTTLNQYLDCSQYSIDVYGDIRLAPESLTVNTHRHTERVQLAQGKEEVKMPKKEETLLLLVIVQEEKKLKCFNLLMEINLNAILSVGLNAILHTLSLIFENQSIARFCCWSSMLCLFCEFRISNVEKKMKLITSKIENISIQFPFDSCHKRYEILNSASKQRPLWFPHFFS